MNILRFKEQKQIWKEKVNNMRKISYNEYLLKIQDANEKIIQKYGNRRTTIQTIGMAYQKLELGVNWSALGTQTIEETRLFVNQLNEVTAMAKSLNEEFKDCEVDWSL